MADNKLDRRSWMSGVGAAAAGMALGATGVDAQTPASPPQMTPGPPATTAFQPARHAIDEWLDKLPGKHRVVFDITSPENSTWGFAYANNFYNANRTGYQVENADLAVVLGLRHSATGFAFNTAMWAKYGKTLADGFDHKDAGGTEPKANPRISTLDGLVKRGAHFAVCGLATRRYALLIAGPNGDIEPVVKELTANTIPNAHIMPAGIVAVARAQEYGYSLIHIG